jgi:hypothetical protein
MEQDVTGMVSDTVSAEDVIAYVDTTIAQMDAKAEKAKERQQAKTKEGDELRAVVKSVIDESPMTGDEITAKVVEIEGYEDITKSKVVARLTQLCKNGEIFKADTRIDGRTLKVYSTEPFGAAQDDAE